MKEDTIQTALDPNFILESLQSWSPSLLSFALRLLVAAVILLIGSRVACFLHKLMTRTFTRMNLDLSLSKFLLSAGNALVYAITIFMALEKIGIPSASILALLGSAGIAIGLSLQDSLKNVAGGILILVMRPFAIHDYIKCDDAEGTVQSIGLVYTALTTIDNSKITIPNGSLANAVVVNVSAQTKRRVDLTVGISYDSDLRLAKRLLLHIYNENPLILKEDEITAFVQELGESAVVLGARGWTLNENYWPVRWELTERIKLEFDEAGIDIPYRQLYVHLSQESAEAMSEIPRKKV